VRNIVVRVTTAHIEGAASRGYGPRIIIAALRDRLVDHVYLQIRDCWLFLTHRGIRYYVHLPLHLLPYTLRPQPRPLQRPLRFRIEVPAYLVRPRSQRARRPPA